MQTSGQHVVNPDTGGKSPRGSSLYEQDAGGGFINGCRGSIARLQKMVEGLSAEVRLTRAWRGHIEIVKGRRIDFIYGIACRVLARPLSFRRLSRPTA